MDEKQYWVVRSKASMDDPLNHDMGYILLDTPPTDEWVEIIDPKDDWEARLRDEDIPVLDSLPQVYALKLGVQIKVPHSDGEFKGHIWLPAGSQHRVIWIQPHRGQRYATIQYVVEVEVQLASGRVERRELTGRTLVALSKLHSYRHYTRIRPEVFVERFYA